MTSLTGADILLRSSQTPDPQVQDNEQAPSAPGRAFTHNIVGLCPNRLDPIAGQKINGWANFWLIQYKNKPFLDSNNKMRWNSGVAYTTERMLAQKCKDSGYSIDEYRFSPPYFHRKVESFRIIANGDPHWFGTWLFKHPNDPGENIGRSSNLNEVVERNNWVEFRIPPTPTV